jgi:hypothetical protein
LTARGARSELEAVRDLLLPEMTWDPGFREWNCEVLRLFPDPHFVRAWVAFTPNRRARPEKADPTGHESSAEAAAAPTGDPIARSIAKHEASLLPSTPEECFQFAGEELMIEGYSRWLPPFHLVGPLSVRHPSLYWVLAGTTENTFSERYVVKRGVFYRTDVAETFFGAPRDPDYDTGIITRVYVRSGVCLEAEWQEHQWQLASAWDGHEPSAELKEDVRTFAARWCAAHPWPEPAEPIEPASLPAMPFGPVDTMTDEELGIFPEG